MKITKRQLRKIIQESFRTAAGGNRPPWADDPLPEPAAPAQRARRPRRINPEQAFRKLQKIARGIGADYASDNPNGDGVVGIEDAARDLAGSALWEAGEDVVAAAEAYIQRDAQWDGIGGEVDLLDMLKDSVASGAYSVSR